MKMIKNLKLHTSPETKARVIEREIDGQTIKRNFEFINDKYLDDMDLLHDPSIKGSFSEYPYEKTYHFKSVDDIKRLVENAEHKKSRQDFLKRNNFLFSTWEAKVPREFTIPVWLMKKLLKYTSEIYDEVTVPYWNYDLSDYEELWDYAAKEIPNSLASWVDIKTNDIISLAPVLQKLKRLNTAKFGFGKMSTHFTKYAFAIQALANKPIQLHLNSCAIRTSINKSTTAVSQAAILLGFNSTTRNCPSKRETVNFFPPHCDWFDISTCKYDKIFNKTLKGSLGYKGAYLFRKARSLCIINSNKELADSSDYILKGKYKEYFAKKSGLLEDAKILGITKAES